MSITDELREWWVRKFPVMDKELHKDFTAIADRIDAEHQKALDEWKAKQGQMWLKGYSECHAELLEGNETLASDLERCGWIRLPKDADDVPWSVGDRDEDGNVVTQLRLASDGWYVIAVGEWPYRPESKRHYHVPSVEDVLREFSEKMNENLGMYTGEAIDADEWRQADSKTIAEYAAKLRLAEGEDA